MKIRKALEEYSSGRNVIIFFIITQICYMFMLLLTIPSVMEYSGGMKLLDMQPTGYSIEYVTQLFHTLGEAGRNTYLFRQIPVDMIYPGLFAITYSLLIFFLFKKSFRASNKIHYIAYVPILAGVFDYLENIGIITSLFIYPKIIPAMVSTMNLFTIAKSTFTVISILALIIGLTAFFLKKMKGNS